MLLSMLLAGAMVSPPAPKPVDAGQCMLLVSRAAPVGAPIFGRTEPSKTLPEKAVPTFEPAVQSPRCKSELPGKLKRKKNQRLS